VVIFPLSDLFWSAGCAKPTDITTKKYLSFLSNYMLMGVRKEAKRPLVPLEIGTKKQKLKKNWTQQILAMAVLFAACHSHCTRTRFTVLVSCSHELAVHSCPLLGLQSQVAKLASELFHRWSLLRNNNMATNRQKFTSSCSSKRFAVCVCGAQTSWLV